MANTEKNPIAKASSVKASPMAMLKKPKVMIGIGVGALLIAAIVAIVIIKPDWKMVESVKASVTQSLPELKAAVQKDPKNASLRVDLGHALFDAKKFDQAVASYAMALSIDSKATTDKMIDNLVACFGIACQPESMELIGKRKLVEAEDGLRKLSRDSRYAVRTGAVGTLEKIGKAQKSDWIVLWMHDLKEENCDVRRNAVEKLGEFGDKSVIAAIKAAAKKDSDSTAWYQASCLGSRSEDAEKKIVARR
jgi:HEAT repeat protein